MTRRELTPGEAEILRIIQEEFGPQNAEQDVFFTSTNEAALFVQLPGGSRPMLAHLTNLALFRVKGIITSEDDLRRNWLRPQPSGP